MYYMCEEQAQLEEYVVQVKMYLIQNAATEDDGNSRDVWVS